MKTFLTGLALLLSSCASQIPTGEYTKAYRTPRVYPITSVDVRDEVTLLGYDLDFDGNADVLLVHKNMDNQPSVRPLEYIWVTRNKKGTYDVYARQGDQNMDGKIDYVSGNVKRMNKWIDRLEK